MNNKYLQTIKIKKDVVKIIKLFLPAQNANVNTMLNATLGQAGVNGFEFSKKFEDISKLYKAHVVLGVKIFIYVDKSFDILLLRPPLSYILTEEFYKNNSVKKIPDDSVLAFQAIKLSEVYKIAFFLKFLGDSNNLKAIVNSLLGTVKSIHGGIINDINE